MKEIQFSSVSDTFGYIKCVGFERAKKDLDKSLKIKSVDFKFYKDDVKYLVDLDFLKRLVESWELVNKHGGLFAAKCQIESECPDLEFGELEYYDDGDVHLTHIKDLEQAIADVESCQ